MTITSDLRYGRQGGRFTGPPVPVSVDPIETPWPTTSELAGHLVDVHRMPAGVVDAHSAGEHQAWHAAEHRTRQLRRDARARHAGHLDHTHPEP